MKEAPIEMIHNYKDAFEIGKQYIDALSDSVRVSYHAEMTTLLPLETASKRWKMTLPALQNTLTYIFEKLHHPCYMLCVVDDTFKIYKLVMKDSSPTFVEAIKTHHIPKLEKNDTITEKQRNFIKSKLNSADNIRVMQCILKEQKLESSNYDMINEYIKVLSEIKLPNGVFILNLTDAVILKNDGKEPFPMVTGDVNLGKYNFREYIPILGMSGQKRYRDVPIPNYDDVEMAMSKAKQQEMNDFTTDWNDKKITKAVFRGGPSGCGYTSETNMRIKLAEMKSEYLDVGITGNSDSINSKAIKFDPKYGLGMMNLNLKPVKRLSMAEQSNYKYIIHIDGNVNAYRLLTTMCTGSLILRVGSEYRSWVDHMIESGVHYVSVKPDLSNLHSCIRSCIKNDKLCRQIANAGRELATSLLQKEYMKNHFQNIFWFFSKYQSPPQPAKTKPMSPPSLPYPAYPKLNIKKKVKPVVKPSSPTTPPPPPQLAYPGSPQYPPPALQKNTEVIHKKWKLPSPSPPQPPSTSPPPKPRKYIKPLIKPPSPETPVTPNKDDLSSPDDTPPHLKNKPNSKTKKGGYVIGSSRSTRSTRSTRNRRSRRIRSRNIEQRVF